MSAIPEQLAAHLAREVTTLCHCWRVARSDGAVLGFTDHDRPLSFDGTDFRPRSGFSASEARETLGLAVDTVDVEGALSSADLDGDEIAAGAFDGATVETFLVNWQAPDARMLLRLATIGRIAVEDGRFVAELESPRAALDRPRGRWFRRHCDAELGDARCGADLGDPAFSGTGTVAAQVSADTLAVEGVEGFAAGWFAHGVLTATDGPAAGRSFRIVAQRTAGGLAELTLWREAGPLPSPGDSVALAAGCDKSFAACKAKFANHLNFRGFPHLPGNDAAYGHAREGGEFDGGPLVP